MITAATLAQYASAAAGIPVTLSCEPDATFPTTTQVGITGPTGPLDGYVFTSPTGTVIRVLHVRQSLCDAAIATTKPHAAVTPDSGRALGVILHEAEHAALNTLDEGRVEACAASNAWQLVRQFKYPARIAQQVLASMAVHHAQMLAMPKYVGACS